MMVARGAGMATDLQLQALLVDVHPHWLGDGLDAHLHARACNSALGRRLLARWLAGSSGAEVLAPSPGPGSAAVAGRWPRARLGRLIRDLGALAYAPAIRGEIRRAPVRLLKEVLGTSYLLALDPVVWDGQVPVDVAKQLQHTLAQVLAVADDESAERMDAAKAALLDVFDRQGRTELGAWAERNDPPLGEWMTLLHPPEALGAAHLPDASVLKLCLHHDTRGPA